MNTLEDLIKFESALLVLRDEDEARRFLSAILSRAEYEKIRKRWQVNQLRAQGMSLAQTGPTAMDPIATATQTAATRSGVPITAGPYELSDAQWQRIAPLLPGEPGNRSRTGSGNRLFVNAVFWVLRSGARWQDLPERYGKWKSVHKRFTRWAKSGVWEIAFDSLTADPGNQYLMLDTTLIRVHQQTADGKRGLRIRLWGVPEED
jgi:transposase/uncharacterized protein YerC